MPISVSQYLGVDSTVFAQTGAFNAILDVDTKLFIDPLLLKSTEAPELQESYDKVYKRFSDILKLLASSERVGDIYWRSAFKLFAFGELKGLCIGYSSSGTSGRGMGRKLRLQVLRTAKEIVDAGIKDPVFFELLGLFESGIGADRISDMVGWIILHDLLGYSERIFREFRVQTHKVSFEDRSYELVINSHNH